MKILKGKNTAAQKVKAGVQKVVKEAKEVGRDIKEAGKEAGEKIKEAGKIAVLQPFKPVLKAALIAKGITPPEDLEKLARLFFAEVVKKSSFDEASQYHDGTNIVLATEPVKTFDPVSISALVSGILTWIQESRAKKAAGKQLTKAQEAAVKTSDIINKEAEKAEVEIIKDEAGEAVYQVFGWLQKNWILIVALVVVGIIAYKNR